MYYFCCIFHDWLDKFCLRLLRALIPNLETGARIVISDFIVPESGTASWYKEGLVWSVSYWLLILSKAY